MAVEVKHKFQSQKADSPDASLIRPSNWNAEHDITINGPALVGRLLSSSGPVQEIKVTTTGAPLEGEIPSYGEGGGLPVGTPSTDNHATPKKWVEDIVGAEKEFLEEAIEDGLEEKLDRKGDLLGGGFTSVTVDDGAQSGGTYTPNPETGNWRKISVTGAFPLSAPTFPGTYNMTIDITIAAGAGVVTFLGFSSGHPKGDPLTMVNGHKFKLHIAKSDIGTSAFIEALQ